MSKLNALTAQESAERWLDFIDDNEYSHSWSEAATYFRTNVTSEQWKKTLQGVREPLGKTITRKLKSKKYEISLPGIADGEYVVIEYDTSFEHKKTALELVTLMLEPDFSWRVAGYFFR